MFGGGHIGHGEMLVGDEVNAVAFLELVVKRTGKDGLLLVSVSVTMK